MGIDFPSREEIPLILFTNLLSIRQSKDFSLCAGFPAEKIQGASSLRMKQERRHGSGRDNSIDTKTHLK